jgi:hypothetical protein
MTNSHTTPSLDKTSATEITDVFAAVMRYHIRRLPMTSIAPVPV